MNKSYTFFMDINAVLLALIAGLLLVMIAKTEHPEKVGSVPELLGITLVNYLVPLVMAVICGAIILGLSYAATFI